ncbi:MAG: bifunctional serine/threonine-protein kinase/formylglycine-generating enzyme family protein [Planctomycetota bacterium]
MTDDPAGARIIPGLEAALEDLAALDSVRQTLRIAELKAAYPESSDVIDMWLYQHDVDPIATPQPGYAVGPYVLRERVGQGGFGEVWVAEQTCPLQRRVAVKLIKFGMDSEVLVQRFAQERQILAALSHEAIAKIFDAGQTPDGRPYLAMEYVEGGTPITDYCDRHRLSIGQRIKLFQSVCDGVQHSHQKGVLHRDLKPDNVLVTRDKDRDVAKIIDFGIARLTGPTVEASGLTKQFGFLGTPEYMAPEQAAGGQPSTTAVDVYSLGAVLYELLAGQQPHSDTALRDLAHEQMLHVLREKEPPRPSARARALPPAAALLAASCRGLRSTSPWFHALRGDLDWITLKALRKEPGERYASPRELAADLQRHLQNEPVIARPPTMLYRGRKFVRRHRVPVAAAALVAVTLAVSSWKFYEQAQRNLILADVQRLADAKVVAADIHALPENVPAMDAWLATYGTPLSERLPDLERALSDLRARARPQTEEERAVERQDVERLAVELEAVRNAQAVRSGEVFEEVALDETAQRQSADELNRFAWKWSDDRKPVYGCEREALAKARLALARLDSGDESTARYAVLDTLAFACYRNGLDEEAVKHSRGAQAGCRLDQKDEYRNKTAQLELDIARWRGAEGRRYLEDLAARHQLLEREVSHRRLYHFADQEDGFLQETLRRLVADLRLFTREDGVIAQIRHRRDEAESVRERSITAARGAWDAACTAIRRSDGVTAAVAYAHLEVEPQVGLVPLGMDPVTKLWEFVHLQSGGPGEAPPAWDATHTHREPMSQSGIVFVLLPGGTYMMGSVVQRPPHLEDDAEGDEIAHRVTLGAFFMSKYELTRVQWSRLWRGENARQWPSARPAYNGGPRAAAADPTCPVEGVSWDECDQLARSAGLELPTEAQWEYACRAGTTTTWYTGSDPTTLAGQCNLLDRPSPGDTATSRIVFADGFVNTAPVGSFPPNRFGLHDMHGNVWEFCRDCFGDYRETGRAGDGLRALGDGSGFRVRRGGCFGARPREIRTANRDENSPTDINQAWGVRLARPLRNHPGRR